jgi:Common central domain of tyrosinase/Polyphenol oxidase middle domain
MPTGFCSGSRRAFLKTATSAAVALGAGTIAPSALRAQPTLRVRQSIATLVADGSPTIDSLRAGIAAMKARDQSDPTSWWFQANIHGTEESDPVLDPFWNRCPHGNFFFLSWHRMYLHHFERILRAASGDDELTLPYWNYSDPAQRGLPLPFRDPADESANALFTPGRWQPINDDILSLGGTAVRIEEAMQSTVFASIPGDDIAFGGGIVSSPGVSGQDGLLESTPHNIVHALIGAGGNLMSTVTTAAQDPIFWLHHANIDRLWVRWIALGEGRANPTDNVEWMTREFTFFDEAGNEATLTAAEILDTQFDLGYRYDDDPERLEPLPAAIPVVVAGGEPPSAALEPAAGPVSAAGPEAEATAVIASSAVAHPAPVVLDATRTRVEIEPGPQAERALESALEAPGTAAAAMAPERVVLVLDDVATPEEVGPYYEIYLNLPQDAEPGPDTPYFVGSFGLFAMPRHHQRSRFVFDLSEALRRQGQEGEVEPSELAVTFIKRGAVAADGSEVLPEVAAPPEIGSIEIKSVPAR